MIDKSKKDSSNEGLEQYGIWVKSEPQDIEEPEEIAFNAETEQELTYGTIDDFESPLNIEIETVDNDSVIPAPSSFESDTAEETSLLTEDDSIIDIPLETLVEQSSPNFSKQQVEKVSEIKAESSSFAVDEVSLDDFLDTTATEEYTSENTTVAVDDFLEQDEKPSSEPEEAIEEIEAIDLDLQFDDTIETPLDTLEEEFSSVDIEGFDTLDNSELSEMSDFELSSESPSIKSNEQNEEAIDVSTMFMADEAPTTKKAQATKPTTKEQPPVQRKTNLDAFIDNEASLPITELSMEEITDEPVPVAEPKSATSDISITILNQIAQELASIKSELASLKSQIQTTRDQKETETQRLTPPTEAKGFFEEEDDETIALTGDELDNILNTASFTVEGKDTGNVEAQELVSETLLEETVDTLLPEDGNYAEEKGIEIIDGSEELEALPNENEKSEFNANEIVETLTPFTELQEDEVQLAEQPDFEALEEIPLEEPDLSQIDLPKTNEELLSTLQSSKEEQEIQFSHPDEAVLDRIVLSIDGSEQVTETLEEASSLPEIEEIPSQEESIELLEEMPLHTIEDESISVHHPDQLKTQLDDSLFIGAEETVAHEASQPVTKKPEPVPSFEAQTPDDSNKIKKDIKTVLLYLDQLLTALPEEKIEEFANSEYYDTYKKLFEELGIL